MPIGPHNPEPSGRQNRRLVYFWLVWFTVTCLIYWPLLAGQVPAFRDGLHFYYPFACWLNAQTSILPMWNPHDGLGSNVIGEMSTAMFYPGRILLWIPVLSMAQRLGLFMLLHTCLAAVNMFYAGRRSHCSRESATLAAISYAGCCPVLFQHTNVIYLVSAAWIPLVIAQCIALLRDGRPNWWLWGLAAAMMLLGGDPQATLVTGLITGLAIAWQLTLTLWNRQTRLQSLRRSLLHAGMFVMSVGLVAGSTAVQWIPTWYWLQQSTRVHSVSTSKTAETHGQLSTVSIDSESLPKLLRDLSDKEHPPAAFNDASTRYAFSVAPWHLLTMIWGTSTGHFTPENCRWLNALRAEPRMWIPSLSIGLLPLLLCLVTFAQLVTCRQARNSTLMWLSTVAMLSLLAMLGDYTPLWAARHIARWLDINVTGWPSDEVGGITWLFTQFVPGYTSLRYPAKWSVWFAGSLCLTSAHGMDKLIRSDNSQHALAGQGSIHGAMIRQLLQWSASIAAVSIVLLAILTGIVWIPKWQSNTEAWLQSASIDAWYGHIHSDVTATWIASSLALTFATSLVFICLCRSSSNRSQVTRLQTTILWLSLLELGIMARTWMVTVEPPPALDGQQFKHVDETDQLLHPPRMWAAIGRANFEEWETKLLISFSLNDSVAQPVPGPAQRAADYQSLFLLGKLHLRSAPLGNLTALGTLTPQALARVRMRIARADDMQPVNPQLDEALAWLGVTHRLVNPVDPIWQAVPQPRPIVQLPRGQAGHVRVTNRTNEHWRIDVETNQPSHLDLRWLQDGGWRAKLIQPSDGRVLEVVPQAIELGLFQRIPLPGGSWIVDLHYQTPGLHIGAWITGCMLTLMAISLSLRGMWLRMRRRSHSVHSEA